MEKEPKKISFGFSKLIKKTNIVLNKEPIKPPENKVQLIDCLEGKSIKVVGGNESINKGPLIIPMKQPNKKLVNLVDLVKNNFVETVENNGTVHETKNGRDETKHASISELSLEEQAALELVNASKKIEKKDDNKRIIEVDKNKLIIEGEKESSLDDYEDVPVDEFGKAMLRGMGWKDGCGIGKNEKLVKVVQPAIRPKGMGLGADKITKQDPNNKPAVDRDGKVLKCVKRAYVKIIAGYHKGSYGQIMGLDDESGRFIIKTAINNLNISLNEFLVVPVTKEEYNKSSKIINNAKYEEYMKKKEEERRNFEQEKKPRIKKERKSESSDADEGPSKRDQSHKSKIEKIKKEKYSDSDEDTYKTKRKQDKYYEDRKPKQKSRPSSSKYEKQDEYDSDEEYKRYRKSRDKKSKKYSSDASESEDEKRHKKSSSKRDEDYSIKKKNKKKKSKKYSSDESDEQKRKSKKSDKKYYSDSDDDNVKRSKSHKRDKKDKDKGRYDRDAR